MIRFKFSQLAAVPVFLGALALAIPAAGRDVTIRIVGVGANAHYIETGQTEQRPVNVTVGDKVVWINEGNRTHTSTAEDDQGRLLFDTGDIAPRVTSHPEEMTAALFENAGGEPGSAVTIDYFCDHHSRMASSLILSQAGPSVRPERVLTRRDITSLDRDELNRYRDAWRLIQGNGDYNQLAGYHGCPRRFCHRQGERIVFLPWHRQYMLQMQQALGQPLHYWDWTSAEAATSGIPRAFLDITYQSADGNVYPNPLRSFRFTCPAGTPPQTTFRNPRDSRLLAGYAAQVRSAYTASDYATVNQNIESPPHDSLHGWVGGMMGGVFYAAYDPIFWAHHSNVDRQWASWQRGGGPNPNRNVMSMSLTGFPGRTVADVIQTADLGYDYDRYDRTPIRRPTPPLESFVAMFDENRDGGLESVDGDGDGGGVGKTFGLASADGLENVATTIPEGALDLYVTGLPEHPADSYFVYVFVDQPNATPQDATPENPNFVGTFGVFGGAPADAHEAPLARSKPKRVLQLGAEGRRLAIKNVTLVVTDQTGEIVPSNRVPFDGVRLAPQSGSAAGPGAIGMEAVETARGQVFTGTSDKESYDEAYQNAVNEAQKKLTAGTADRLIKVKVLSVEGTRGGIAGLRRLTITIRAWLQ